MGVHPLQNGCVMSHGRIPLIGPRTALQAHKSRLELGPQQIYKYICWNWDPNKLLKGGTNSGEDILVESIYTSEILTWKCPDRSGLLVKHLGSPVAMSGTKGLL